MSVKVHVAAPRSQGCWLHNIENQLILLIELFAELSRLVANGRFNLICVSRQVAKFFDQIVGRHIVDVEE